MRLDDTILDNPSAEQEFTSVVDEAIKEKLISTNAKVSGLAEGDLTLGSV